MKILTSPASPFGRKTRITVFEKKLEDLVSIEFINPWLDPKILWDENPIGKVPVLIIDGQKPLLDSRVICEYLNYFKDTGDNTPNLYAPDKNKWHYKRLEALADNISEQGILVFLEKNKEAELQSSKLISRLTDKIIRALDDIEDDINFIANNEINIGQIALASTLGWLDFRMPDFNWRENRKVLDNWYSEISKRPSFSQCIPE